jgi:TonB family protein
MSANDTTLPVPPAPLPGPGPEAGRAVHASGWLGSQSIFDRKDDRKIGRAMGASLAAHLALVAVLAIILTVAPQTFLRNDPPLEYKVVFLQEPGPGGGGGGSPAPAPPKPMEIPKPKAPDPIPVTPPPPIPVPVLQSTGQSSVSLAPYGGGGRGGGIGPGTGNGVGPGTGGGFGGGAYRPGSGVSFPTLIRQEQPKYTSEAMRAKVQGSVELEAVILENGTVGEVRIMKSLDKVFGLDQEAITAARKWLFRPGIGPDGKPVATIVTLILEFRLH